MGIPRPEGVRVGAGISLIVIVDREGMVRQTYTGGTRRYDYFLAGVVPYL